jgi:hypothetical protein
MNRRKTMPQAVTYCDQCDGTGWIKGTRCGCHEEDDAAQERRKQMAVCPHQLRHDVEPPPRFMQHLPIFRGYPVPAFVEWIGGEPEFRAMNPRHLLKAINQRLCWTCGNPLYGEEVFVIGPMCAVNRISSEPPSHRECALYAAKNCPFLSRPQMVRRTDGLPEERTAAGVMVERNPGVTLLYYTRRHTLISSPRIPEAGANAGVLFELGRPFKVEWYARGRPATRAEILESINSGIDQLRAIAEKHDGPEGMKMLDAQVAQAMRLLPRE